MATDVQTYTVDLEASATITVEVLPELAGLALENAIAVAAYRGDTVEITGTAGLDAADAGEITLTVNGNTYTGEVGEEGTYSIAVAASDLVDAESAAGTTRVISVTVEASDEAGNPATASAATDVLVRPVQQVQFTDNFVDGVSYTTTSGLSGTTGTNESTGEAGAQGSFLYRAGDTITLTLGSVIIAEFSADQVQGDVLFLQDIAGVPLSDVNNEYVENMAIFLQALDADANPENGIQITPETAAFFEGYTDAGTGEALNLATAGKQMLANALSAAGEFTPEGFVFTAVSETDPVQEDGSQNVFETGALDHVAETIEDLSGVRDPEGFDERTPDTIEVPGGIIDYNFNFDAGQNGEITFTRDDLLVGAVPQQVTYDNLEVSEVALSEGFTEIGELTFDEATGVYTIALNEGITRADVSGLTVDYQVRDWTAVVDAVATTLDESALTGVDDTAQGDEDTAILGSVADNDTTTSGGTLSYAVNTDLFVAENEDGSFTLSQGVLTLDPEFSQNGQYSFQPNENYNGTDSFSYTVTDSESGERAVQTVTITVDAVNDAPVILDADSEGFVTELTDTAGDTSSGTTTVTGTTTTGTTTVTGTTTSDTSTITETTTTAATTLTDTGTITFEDVDLLDMHTAAVTGSVTNAAGEAVRGQLTLGAVDNTEDQFGGLGWTYSVEDGALDDLSEGETRVETFTVALDDGNGGVVEQDVVITITGTNDGPVAVASVGATTENAVLDGNVKDATDVDGTIASYALAEDLSAEEGGSLTFNADGSYSFDPGSDFDDLAVEATRDVTFTYTATDNDGQASAPATVTITVKGTNDGPVAVASVGATTENAVLDGNVKDATDVDGTIASYALAEDLSAEEGGSLTFNADGSYSFDPGSDFDDLAVEATRDVTFTYTATDNDGQASAPATVTITVKGTNDGPVAVASVGATTENAVLDGNVKDATDVDGTIASYALAEDLSAEEGGSLTFNADGSYSFDPGSDFDDLAVEATRDVTFTYTATDNDGQASAPATVTITVKGTNDGPVAVASVGATTENAVLDGNVKDATDVDGTIASYALAEDLSAEEGGSLTFNADGSYSFDPGSDFDDLAVEATRDVTFTYTATDNDGQASAPATVTITVKGTNDGPVAVASVGATTENAVLDGNVKDATDVDGTIASYALAEDLSAEEGGSLTFNADGSYSFDPGSDFDDLAVEATRDVTFTYTATDNDGQASAPATVTITVKGTNDGPVAVASVGATTENAVLDGNVKDATDVDGTIASYALAEDLSAEEGGSLTFNADGSYSFDPGSDFDDLAVEATRDVTFTYTATDNDGQASAPATVTITVKGTNDGPVAVASVGATTENAVLDGNVKDATDVDGTIASYALAEDLSAEEGGSLTFNADGSYSFDPGSDFDDLAVEATRDVTFTYTATDNDGQASAPATVTITVKGTNDGPVAVASVGATTENAVLDGNVKDATDVDGTIASYALAEDLSAEEGGSLTFNADGSYSFDPGSDFDDLAVEATRDVTFTYTATDNDGQASAPATVTITVKGTNDGPVAVASVGATTENAVLDGNVKDATDVDGTIASYALAEDLSAEEGGSLTFNADGSYSFDPGSDFDDLAVEATRDVTFTYTATDNDGQASAPATVTITVKGTNDGPVAVASVGATTENAVLDGNVKDATDVDGTIASYALAEDLSAEEGGSLTFNADGSYSFDPGSDFDDLAVEATRDVTFTYTATDNDGQASAPATVTITVKGTNDGPVAVASVGATTENAVLDGNVKDATDVDGTIASYALAEDLSAEEGGSLTFNADGSYSFDPGSDFDDLAVEATRDVTFTYTATDNDGQASAPATVTITVKGTNDGPVAVASVGATTENAVLDGNVKDATDVDGTIASYALAEDLSAEEGGSLTFNADGSYSFDPGSDFDDLAVEATRDVTFTYTATDNDGQASAPATVTITVKGTNDGPVAVASVGATTENAVLDGNVKDATDVDGTIASYALAEDLSAEEGGSLTFNADGSYSFDPGSDFDDLAVEATRDVTFTYTATDNDGQASAPATVTITVKGTNDGPVAVADTGAAIEDAGAVTLDVLANDTDADTNAVLTVTAASITSGASGSAAVSIVNNEVVFNPGDGYQTLNEGEKQDVEIKYTITDDQGATSTSTVTVTVTGVNDQTGPTIAPGSFISGSRHRYRHCYGHFTLQFWWCSASG